MPKSTIILGMLCVLLAAVTVGVWQRAELAQPLASPPAVEGAFALGLPGGGSVEAPLAAASALVWNSDTGAIEFEHRGFERRPIASLTKIMTAIVALDISFDWDQATTIQPPEYVIGGRLLLHPGETVTMRDLWHAMLLGSANNATLALVRELKVPEEEFIREMNRKAIALGLEQTSFVDVTGLDPDNISTAYDVARLLEAALRDYPAIAATTALPEYQFRVGGSGREHTLRHTNTLLSKEGLALGGSKTGFLYEAGFCLAAHGGAFGGNRIAVVLGSPSESESGQEIKLLLQSGYGGV